MFNLILTQTLIHAFRKGGGAFGTCAFYVIIITLFTFALSPETLHAHAGAVMCVAMLLANITAMPLMFERDYEDGTLEQYTLWPVALEILILAKMAGHWLAIIVPILLVSPVMAIFAGLEVSQAIHALFILLLASASMVALSAIVAALTIGAKRGGLLQALVTLPLYTPILIFAASAGERGVVLFLSGILFASIPFACWVAGALIRMGLD